MAEDGEEVVFANSALYQHLKDVGYSDAEVSPEDYEKPEFTEDSPLKGIDIRKPKSRDTVEKVSLFSIKSWWTEKRYYVEKRYCEDIAHNILKFGILEEEDEAFLHNFMAAVSDQEETDISHAQSKRLFSKPTGIIAITSVAIMAYAFPRMMDLNTFLAGTSHLWVYGSLFCLVGICIVPAIVCLIAQMGWRYFGHRTQKDVQCLLQVAKNLNGICKKSIRLIQEIELVHRGFTLATPQAPISRLEQSGTQPIQRECPQLRQLLFFTCREMMIEARAYTRDIINKCDMMYCGSGGGYLAHMSLDEYGPCVTLTDQSKISAASDKYSIAAIKAMYHLFYLHMSELFKQMALGFIFQNSSKAQVLTVTSNISCSLQEIFSKHLNVINQAYQLHYCAVIGSEESNVARPRAQHLSEMSNIYIGVHSLKLHLHAALRKVHKLDEELEAQCESKAGNFTKSVQKQLKTELKVIEKDLDACKVCLEESFSRAEGNVQPTKKTDLPSNDEEKEVDMQTTKEAIHIFDIGDPIIQDQVFEAYTDPDEDEGYDNIGVEPFLTKEEKEKRKKEQQEAKHLLKELQSVISTRGQRWEEREDEARRRMACERGDHRHEHSEHTINLNEDIQQDTCACPIEQNIFNPCDDPKHESHSEESKNMQDNLNRNHPVDDNAENTGSDNIAQKKETLNWGKCKTSNVQHITKDSKNEEIKDKLSLSNDAQSDLLILKSKLATSSLGFTSHVAAMVATQSHSLGLVSETFGDSSDEEETRANSQ